MENNSVKTKSFYDRYYKTFLIIPALILLVSLVYLYSFNAREGDIILKDVSLTGGTTVTVFDGNINLDKLKTTLSAEFPDLIIRGISNIRTGSIVGVSVESTADAPTLKAALEKYLGYTLDDKNSSVEFSGSTLSSGFYQQLRFAIMLAFLFMAIVVFLIFRTPVPSAAIIISAFADIVMTIAFVDFLGMRLSTAGIIAFLMLIGYSVDTDILLTSRLLKKKEGSLNERLRGAFNTGMTMTVTAIASVVVALAIIYTFSETLRQIFTIITIGLVFDIMNTWLTNASILKWYMEHKGLS